MTIQQPSTTSNTSTSPPQSPQSPLPSPPPPTVCVIGGGPGAMFFCHALETQKKLLLEKGEDITRSYTFPVVKCFERAPGPGGVWRSDRTHGEKKSERNQTKNESKNEDVNVIEDIDDEDSSVNNVSSIVNDNSSIDMDDHDDHDDDITDTISSASSAVSADNHHHLDLILSSPSLVDTNENDEKKVVDETLDTSTITTSSSLTYHSSSSFLTTKEEGVEVVAEEATAKGQGQEPKTNMYSALWTNGPKENLEFYDYTFVDHFGVEVASKLPTYLPRKLVVEYLVARCTNHCPTFFEDYFSFQTTVLNVKYLEEDDDDDDQGEGDEQQQHKNKFQITLQDETTGITSMEYYDKCIWAGGNEGVPFIPEKTKQLFENANNNNHCTTSNNNNNNNGSSSTTTTTTTDNNNNNKKFRIVHSSDTSNFKSDVEHKNVLIIGGGYSTEDLALMAIKEGVSHIYITYHGDYGDGLTSTRWPYDKVTVHLETCVTDVTRNNNNNDNNSNAITLTKCKWCYKERKYVLWSDEDYKTKGLSPIVVNTIDTIIFCTGYEPNFKKMLDETLYPYNQSKTNRDCQFQVPPNWTMHDEQKDNDMNANGADESLDDNEDSLSASWKKEDGEDFDIEEYLSLLNCKLSQQYFGKNYKQIENDITPSDYVYTGYEKYASYANHLDTLYRGTFSIKNTNMMYLVNQVTDTPLLEIEVTSWMIAKVISKQALLPDTKEDMMKENININLKVMKCPIVRYDMDPSYKKAIDSTFISCDTWEHINKDQIDKVEAELYRMIYKNSDLALGKYMIEYDYPVSLVDIFDSADDNTATTTTAASYCYSKYYNTVNKYFNKGPDETRFMLDKLECDDDDDDKKDNNNNGFWRTFRDHPHTDNFVSYFTGLKSVPLSKRWFDLNEDDTLW